MAGKATQTPTPTTTVEKEPARFPTQKEDKSFETIMLTALLIVELAFLVVLFTLGPVLLHLYGGYFGPLLP